LLRFPACQPTKTTALREIVSRGHSNVRRGAVLAHRRCSAALQRSALVTSSQEHKATPSSALFSSRLHVTINARPRNTFIKMARTRLLALCAISAASAFAPRPYLGVTASRRAPASTVVTMGGAKNGIFSPIVRLAKRVVGKERFLSFRGRVIGSAQIKLCALDATPDYGRGGT